jgi:hypothetical protein
MQKNNNLSIVKVFFDCNWYVLLHPMFRGKWSRIVLDLNLNHCLDVGVADFLMKLPNCIISLE